MSIDCLLETRHPNRDYAQIWKINNSLYDLLYLPSLFLPNLPYGITIEVVEKSMNQVSFQCYIPMADGDGLNLEAGEIDKLIVTEKGIDNAARG